MVISFGYVGRPVQQDGAGSHVRVASDYDDPPEIERRSPESDVRPDGPHVQVERFFGVDGDGGAPGRDGTVPGDPDLAFDQVIQYPLTPSLRVWPGFRPLIGLLLVGSHPAASPISPGTSSKSSGVPRRRTYGKLPIDT